MIEFQHREPSQGADDYLQRVSHLKRQMLATRSAVDRASDQCIRLELLRLDEHFRNEASQLLEQAMRLHRIAYQAHFIALRRYHDFVELALSGEKRANPPNHCLGPLPGISN
jgi:hypothetical protein